jgi:hypothetical protein
MGTEAESSKGKHMFIYNLHYMHAYIKWLRQAEPYCFTHINIKTSWSTYTASLKEVLPLSLPESQCTPGDGRAMRPRILAVADVLSLSHLGHRLVINNLTSRNLQQSRDAVTVPHLTSIAHASIFNVGNK